MKGKIPLFVRNDRGRLGMTIKGFEMTKYNSIYFMNRYCLISEKQLLKVIVYHESCIMHLSLKKSV